jgi:predicted phage baseplate assembly protein
MVEPTPKIDQRTAQDVAKQVHLLLGEYLPQEFRRPDGELKELKNISAALVGIFARFSEIIIQRLNQVPEKNFLAFLNLLGASRQPPQPARVPLTFSLATGSTVDAVVPAGTQVAAPPTAGQQEPVIFETERTLLVTAAQLASIFVRDPQQDTWSDRSSLVSTTASADVPVFRGNQKAEHIFYIAHKEILGASGLQNLRLNINLSKPLGDQGKIQWQIWQESTSNWVNISLPLGRDGTQNFSLTDIREIGFDQISALHPTTINGLENYWLRCVLLTPITLAPTAQTGMVRQSQLPTIENITIAATLQKQNLLIEKAFVNQSPVDLSKDFFPFGEKPKFGDTLYLASQECFSKKNTSINLDISLTNPSLTNTQTQNTSPIPPVRTDGNAQIQWEYWNGEIWEALVSSATANNSQGEIEFPENISLDTTAAFTLDNSQVLFTFPQQPVATTINGVESFWIRVRLISGNYGEETRYETSADSPGYRIIPATFAPPAIHQIKVQSTLNKTEPPDVIFTYNNLEYSQILNQQQQVQKFSPFTAQPTDQPSLYLGFTLPANRSSFPNRTISLFHQVATYKYAEDLIPISPTQSRVAGNFDTTVSHKFLLTNDTLKTVNFSVTIIGNNWETTITSPSPISINSGATKTLEVQVKIPTAAAPTSDRSQGITDLAFLQVATTDNPTIIYTATLETFVGTAPPEEQTTLTWQYWNGQQWTKLTVRDQSEDFTRSGLVEFLAPADFTTLADFGLSPRYWLRVQWVGGDYEMEPRLQQILLNTIMAKQTVTIRNENLGSSDGSENQRFNTIQTPILQGQQLQVREPELPSANEQESIKQIEGEDAITQILDPTGRPQEIWVRWHEVTDFYASSPRDRHYILNHITGEIQFGDGINGLIPPVGIGNLRLTLYQTGGGAKGNTAAGSIVQLKTTVPYIDKVTNYVAAAGGADAESLDSLKERMPRTIRHGNRAVTVEDYEDLAMLASPEVARAKCIPLVNLRETPLYTPNSNNESGKAIGEVSVIIVPRSLDAKPVPSVELINRVQDYLENHAIPTAKIVVVGPIYIQVNITVEVALVSLTQASTIEQEIDYTLNKFLHPLTGDFDGKGWSFGRKPYKSDLYRLIEKIPGVDHIRNLQVERISELSTGELTQVESTNRFLVYSGKHKITLSFTDA